MENWGLITIRENKLFYDEMIDNLQTKENIVRLIAHEISHQWFGNLGKFELQFNECLRIN